MTTLAHLTPYTHPNLPVVAELRAEDLTDSELAFCWRHLPSVAISHELPTISYDNGVPADGLSGVGHG